MVLWFGGACIIGYETGNGVMGILRKDPTVQPGDPGLEPLFHPSIKYKRDDIKDPRLLSLTAGTFAHNAVGLGAVLYIGGVVIIAAPFFIFVQGWAIGAIVRLAGYQALLHRTLPHGVIELPVMLVTCSIVTVLAFRLYQTIRAEAKRSFGRMLKDTTVVYLSSLPLLLLAAVLECYGTRILWGET